MFKNLWLKWQYWRLYWQQYQSILLYFHRKQELENLADWAKRKKLGVFHHYKRLIGETEHNLAGKNMRYPQIFKYARWVYQINTLVSAQSKHYPQGYASKYSRPR